MFVHPIRLETVPARCIRERSESPMAGSEVDCELLGQEAHLRTAPVLIPYYPEAYLA